MDDGRGGNGGNLVPGIRCDVMLGLHLYFPYSFPSSLVLNNILAKRKEGERGREGRVLIYFF
jgi:hypothetical protein